MWRILLLRDVWFTVVILSGMGVVRGEVLTLGLLTPHSGPRSFGPEVEVTMTLAINKANVSPQLEHLRARNITFQYIKADTECDIGTGLYELVQMNSQVDAFIGPACDSLCQPAGLLAGKWNKPMISYSCYSSILSNRALFPTFARTSALYIEMTSFIVDFLLYHNWDRVAVVQGPEEIWRETAGHFQPIFERNGVQTEILSIPSEDPHQTLVKHLTHTAAETRVFIISAYAAEVLYVMCAAESGNMLHGDYVFIAIDFVYMTTVNVDDRPCDKTKYLEGLLDITVLLDTTYSGYQNLTMMLGENVGGGVHGPEVSIRTAFIYDAVYLYALGLDHALRDGFDATNGTSVINSLLDHTFKGITGHIQLDENGTRRASFALYNLARHEYTFVAKASTQRGSLEFASDILWPGGSSTPPLGRPVCGWLGEHCAESNSYVPVFTSTGIVLLLFVSLSSGMAVWMYRKKKLQEKMESMSWKISYDELDFKTSHNPTGSSNFSSSKHTFSTMFAKSPSGDGHRRTNSFDSAISMYGQVFIKVGLYKGMTLAVKSINKSYIAITPTLIKEINEIRTLSHRNINPLIGACIDPMKTCILSLYVPKGSLQDVLGNDDIKLDQIFKISFCSDIARGMQYIHASCIKSHGHLKSSNIFIDQNWACKIGDIGMPVFREGERPFSAGDARRNYQLLWTAPELLRYDEASHRGTQKGDVYAYGIILQEIILRTVPYGYMNMDPEDIIDAVKEKQTPPFRPLIPPVETVAVLDDIMRMCWEEVPIFRPNFATVLESLKKLYNGKTTNLVDQMIHMMAKYADHLEELVKERTVQLEAEQKRTEELLCRMLPRTIANDLKAGKSVHPETYECVTIYFSDIVGFTALSSHSTPMEIQSSAFLVIRRVTQRLSGILAIYKRYKRRHGMIVNFLNDLYTCFDTVLEDYDVYKVETIGDAYMVVSGLPVRNGNRHAGEIASMALDLLSHVTTFKIRHRGTQQLQVRIGLHSGHVCAGVVGLKMPRYCLFGDAVNYASRMESSGLALRIHVSPECKLLLEELDGFYFECRGYVTMKGKGSIQTYWLLGRQGFSKQLPDLELAAPKEDHEFK